jgi:hypothetical protein
VSCFVLAWRLGRVDVAANGRKSSDFGVTEYVTNGAPKPEAEGGD